VRIGLRISVATARGAREGVPRLLAILDRHHTTATFYFNLGPSRLHRWLPGREIGIRADGALRAVREAGHELGLLGWDPARWPHRIDNEEPGWAELAMQRACEVFERLTGAPARTHAAPGWRTSRRGLRLTQRHGFDYASDVRGTSPFMPVCSAELVLCPQLPTTLPALDRAGTGGERLQALSEAAPGAGHVFALAADGEGFASEFERLLEAWRASGHEPTSMRALYDSLDLRSLPRCTLRASTEAGSTSAPMLVQGSPFLA
jgi:undecaprenyl phosphate-alpha-L-ara4FN deformylase